MNVGWIYPHRDRCGIARYSADYAAALDTLATVIDIDPEWWHRDRKRFAAAVGACDIVHLQYDTPVYLAGHRDFFLRMMKTLPAPAVVSLHEVYDENPFVFPRSEIKGNRLARLLRLLLWNSRHPVDAAHLRHSRHGFGAHRILVHHEFHRDILARKGIADSMVTVFPHPMHLAVSPVPFGLQPDRPLRLGAHGFLQPAFDFDLLFATLHLLQTPWTFTWIGGLRTEDRRSTLDEVNRRIDALGWRDRFHLTGWIDEQYVGSRLAAIDLVLALFNNRSSSGSIARALSHGKPVIATELPMTVEIAGGNRASHRSTASPILTVPAQPDAIVRQINEFTGNGDVRMRLYEGITAYVEDHSFEKSAQKLITLYRDLLAK